MKTFQQLTTLLTFFKCTTTHAASSSGTSPYYGNSSPDWLGSSTNIAMQVEGCVWSTSDDNEDLGCMEDGSEDGTTYWYQMAMCRRAQVAYSLYASSSGSSNCGSSKFVGSVSKPFVSYVNSCCFLSCEGFSNHHHCSIASVCNPRRSS